MYCPPESGIIAPSSAYAKAPKNEMTPAITQTARIIMGDGNSRAIVPGTMKIPTPMVVPITIQVESSRFSSRGRSAGLLVRPGFICPFIGLHGPACQDVPPSRWYPLTPIRRQATTFWSMSQGMAIVAAGRGVRLQAPQKRPPTLAGGGLNRTSILIHSGGKTTVCTALPEGQTMWNDTELQHDIENEVGWELSAGLTQISVTVKSGAVELGGHVDSFWEKCAAERAAWRVAHVNHVTNGIRVVLPFNKQRDDDDIALAAMSSLEWNCLVPETVEVQVAEGWVTLSGSVERQQQKEEAARALCTLNGI